MSSSNRTAWVGILAAAAVGLAAGCQPDASNSENLFRQDVLPVLESRCAASVCHGITAAERAAGVELPPGSFVLEIDDRGRIADWRQARGAARRAINTVEDPKFSSLLRKPLPRVWSGLPHQGGENFTSPEDPGYTAIARWIESEEEGGEDPDPRALTPEQTYFSQRVQPMLVGRSCAVANCHGPTAFIPFRLHSGVASDDGRVEFDKEATLSNYRQVRPFLSLDGHPTESRVLKKAMPLQRGGIVHRGGNRSFIRDASDPAYRALVEWAEMERAAAVGQDAADQSSRILFVRGPLRSQSIFDPSGFVGGRDLMLWTSRGDETEEVNLTAAHHDQPADIRSPDASPEATHAVFSMALDRDEAHRLYEIELSGGELRQLTDGPETTPSGRTVADLWPVYGSDGHIYFASNRHDVVAESLDGLDYDIYRVPRDGGEVERLTYTPAPELEPTLFRVGPLNDYLVFSYRRAIDYRDQTVGFSFPLDFHVDYHIYFGITAEADLLHQFSEMPDGRALVTVGDSQNAWGAGQLAIVDRNLGPDLPSNADPDEAALPAYANTLRVLSQDVRPRGLSPGGAYRDPVAMPNGTILAARAEGEFDLSDPDADPDFDLVQLTVREATDSCVQVECEPFVVSMEPVVTTAEDEFHPEPVYRWPAGTEEHSELNSDEPALFSMSDATVNDGIMANLPPVGKQFRDDVRYIRFVEALPLSPDDWSPVEFSGDEQRRASNLTLGSQIPSRVLGEIELSEDHSVYVELPAETPFRTQLLNEDRMVVGVQHNRWLFNWKGQHFKQSMPRGLYDQNCAGCHGAASGEAEDVLGVPDLNTRATVTLARYQDRNPRMPREPVQLGASTRQRIDFVDHVGPMVDENCADAGCHAADEPAGGLVLSGQTVGRYSTAYESLLGVSSGSAYVDWRGGRARSSELVEIVYGRQFDASGDPAGHPSVELDEQQRLDLVRWIEVGAPYEIPQGAP